jgi:hypothetical protein
MTQALGPAGPLLYALILISLGIGLPIIVVLAIRFLWYRHMYIGRSRELDKHLATASHQRDAVSPRRKGTDTLWKCGMTLFVIQSQSRSIARISLQKNSRENGGK